MEGLGGLRLPAILPHCPRCPFAAACGHRKATPTPHCVPYDENVGKCALLELLVLVRLVENSLLHFRVHLTSSELLSPA